MAPPAPGPAPTSAAATAVPAGERPEPVADETGQLGATAAKYDLGSQDDLLLDALGDLPPGYDQTYVALAARDPEWLFAYWDVNEPGLVAEAEALGWDRLTLRVHHLGGESFDLRVGPRGGRWYVRAPQPDGRYYVELGFTGPEGRFQRFAVSNEVATPPAEMAEEMRPAFATVPWEFERQDLVDAGREDWELPPRSDSPDEALRRRIERALRPQAASPRRGASEGAGDPEVSSAPAGTEDRPEAAPERSSGALPRVHDRPGGLPASGTPPPARSDGRDTGSRPGPSSLDRPGPSSATGRPHETRRQGD